MIKRMDIEHYKPEVIEAKHRGIYALMLVQLCRCPICDTLMLYIPESLALPFPAFFKITAKAQAERAGWAMMSLEKQDGKCVCENCLKAGKITFECSLCSEKKPTSKIQESIGYPAEHLCTDCYTTVPAEKWLKKLRALEQAHRWDYE